MLWYDTVFDVLRVYNWSSWDEVWSWNWDVIWPSSAVDWHIAVFDWATGKLLKDWWVLPTAWITNNTTWTTSMISQEWVGTKAEFEALSSYWNIIYNIIE
jgi:hypothetical protein